MRVVAFTSPSEFAACITPVLREREAENNLMLGIVAQLSDEGPPGGLLLRAVEDDRRAIAAATMTPPARLIVTRMDEAAVTALIDSLDRDGVIIPGVMGPVPAADQVATMWASRHGMAARRVMSLRLYQLDRVTDVPSASGHLRSPRDDERDLLIDWLTQFGIEIGEPHRDVAAGLERRINQGSLYFWDDAGPVAMAGWAGPTPNGVRINAVYTPRHLRKRGYASACVAALSQKMLDSGRKFCFLFTDLSNPTTNSIYQKIGYRAVCDCAAYDFSPGSTPEDEER